jgi:hypothetical protein
MEIVDLGNGEIVLQRSDNDTEPMVTIRFSEEARVYLEGKEVEVAKAMFQAGIHAAASLSEQSEEEVETPPEDAVTRILH